MASQPSSRSSFLFFFSSTNTANDTSRAKKVAQHFKRTFAEMVGKSNKFDFTNRSIGGVKLGLVIAEAFRKEVDKAQKDHDRQSAKAHKQRLAGAAAVADTGKDLGIHIIDFKAPSKDLGDEGVLAMTPGLHTAIASGSSEAFLCLEDINLSGNGLTAIALGDLGKIINVTMHDLKTLNVSGNNVVINDSISAKQWEVFLRSFSGSLKLRRLDLSGNKLDAKAFEIFARVYELEKHITPLRLGGDTSVLSIEEDARQHRESKQYAIGITQKGNRASAAERSLADSCLMKRRCGLRSFPYIDLRDTGLDDAGALWLSFVLPQHFFPVQLLDGINGVAATSTVGIYQQAQDSTGLEWGNNEETLGRDGFQLLTDVESIRKETLYEDADRSRTNLNDDEESNLDLAITSPTALEPRASITNLRDAVAPRKLSGRFIPNLSEAELSAASLSQTRHRIQRHIIQQQGVHSIDLWSSAIDLVVLSRRLLVLERCMGALALQVRNHGPIKDVTNKQKLRRGQQWSHLRKKDSIDAFRMGALQDEITKVGAATRVQYFNYQVERSRPRDAREHSLVGVVPFSVFRQILRHIMSDDEVNVLNESQQRAAYAFGQTRDTLALEREWTRLNDSAQVLKLLDHIGCLAYEGRT